MKAILQALPDFIRLIAFLIVDTLGQSVLLGGKRCTTPGRIRLANLSLIASAFLWSLASALIASSSVWFRASALARLAAPARRACVAIVSVSIPARKKFF